MRFRLASGLLLAAGFLLLAVPTGAAATKFDIDNGNYLVGALTWNDGKGRVSWTGAASTDPGGPGSDVASDVYVADPLPRTVHLNASRHIELDLYTPDAPTHESGGSSCVSNPQLGAELHAGSRLVGGVRAGATAFSGVDLPGDAPGIGVCRIRIAVETDVLEKGTVLRLKVTHGDSDTVFPSYRMGGENRSVLRIPYFSADEVPYRYPSYAHGAPPSARGASGVDEALKGLGLGGLAAAVPSAGLLRRRRTAILLVFALVAGALGGCLGHASPRGGTLSGDPVVPTSLAPSYQEGNLSQKGFGALIGQTLAGDTGQAVEGAYVVLVGTPRVASTDPYGRFVFKDLAAGTYHLRIDRAGYEPFEGSAAVVADLIARVNVTLAPLGVGDAGQRPHLHDYWGDATELTLMKDFDVGFLCQDAANTALGNPCVPYWLFSIPLPPTATEYSSILPGTRNVTVTLDWDPAEIGYAQAELAVQHNADPSTDNETFFLPRGPGQAFNVATTWEMEDPGHQHFSTWSFRIGKLNPTAPKDQVSQLEDRWLNRRSSAPTFKATVVIHKGTVPLERAHRDFWNGGDALDILHGQSRGVTNNIASSYPQEPYKNTGWWNVNWHPAHVIPPDTQWLEVLVNASRDRLQSYEIELRFRTAVDGPPGTWCWRQTGTGPGASAFGYQCDGPEYRRLVSGDRHARWVVPLHDAEADPFYAVRSFWVFGLQPKQEAASAALLRADFAANGALMFSLTVVAHRDAVPT